MTTPAHFAKIHPEKSAVILGDHVLSYAQLDGRSASTARLFRACGLGVGSVVALLTENNVDTFVVSWATQRSGLYLVPIGTKLTAVEIAYILSDCQAGILVCSSAMVPLAQAAIAALGAEGQSLQVFEFGGTGDHYDALVNAAYACAHHDLVEVEGADMLYTSGTTGRPKGVKRALSGVAFGADTSRSDRSRDLFDMDGETVFLSPAPLYHAAPLRFAMSVHRLGGTVVLMDRFDAIAAWGLLHSHGVTHSQWAPTMFNRLLGTKAVLTPHALPQHHRVAIHAGAPCPIPVKHAMVEWWGPILHEYYSGTESIGFTHIDSHDWLKKVGSVGQPIGCKAHIVDAATGNSLPPLHTGGVYFEGRATLSYHNGDDKTAAATHANGWATMGDIGHLDADGFLFLTDRVAFTIISGGVNIYPKEVEDALMQIDFIDDVAVFGISDADLGEAVTAAIVLKSGINETAATARTIGEKLGPILSAVKRPKRVLFCDALPRSDAGKLLKRDLQALFTVSQPPLTFPIREVVSA